MKLHIFDLPETDPCAVFAPLAGMPYSLLLDSADRAHPDARYSFIAALPAEMIESRDGMVTITNAGQQTSFAADPFETVRVRLKAWELDERTAPDLPPFQGGAAGFFGYDLARQIEKIPAKAAVNKYVPDMAIGIYDQVIAFDHQTNKAIIMTRAENEKEAERKRNFLLAIINAPSPAALRATPSPQWGEGWGEGEIRFKSNFTPDNYKQTVHRVIEYICAGDIFQANLSQRFDAELPQGFDAFAHYMDLREINPAPFAGFFNIGNVKISSASPERFLTASGGIVQTKPIKGTRPRMANPADDKKQIESLYKSEKDRAENIMIVDLMRNDLSKVCEPESVAVEKLCEVETFAGVHHLVSTITAKLKHGQSPLPLLKACFPGGSVTGAPKIRAMEIIEDLEPRRRGPYCGAMGYIGFDGAMDLNILIRTLIYEGKTVSFQAGGGITADSTPEEEFQETLDKAEKIFKSFERPAAKARKTG